MSAIQLAPLKSCLSGVSDFSDVEKAATACCSMSASGEWKSDRERRQWVDIRRGRIGTKPSLPDASVIGSSGQDRSFDNDRTFKRLRLPDRSQIHLVPACRPTDCREPSCIDRQVDAGYRRGTIRCEKGDDFGDLIRQHPPPQRGLPGKAVVRFSTRLAQRLNFRRDGEPG